MATPDVSIRAESADETAQIDKVVSAAFLNAPHSSHTEAVIVDALRRAGKLTVSLVATQDGEVVGHVAISPVSIDGQDMRWFGLGPVAVLPACQRHGIGSALVMNSLLALAASGAAGCVVLGDPGFYERFGFKADDTLTLSGARPGHFLTVAFGSTVPKGEVRYHDAFHATGG